VSKPGDPIDSAVHSYLPRRRVERPAHVRPTENGGRHAHRRAAGVPRFGTRSTHDAGIAGSSPHWTRLVGNIYARCTP